MKKFILTCALLVPFLVSAAITVTRDGSTDWICADADGVPLSNHTRIDKAFEACTNRTLGDGLVYRVVAGSTYAIQSDGVVVPPAPVDSDSDGVNDDVDQCPDTTQGVEVDAVGCEIIPPDADGDGIPDAEDECPNDAANACNQSSIPFGDIDALEAGGWVPKITNLGRAVAPKTRETIWGSTTGERGEIGLFTEWQAAYLATRDEALKQNIIEYARKPYLGGSYEHSPNEYYLGYLLTQDPFILAQMEAMWAGYKSWRNQPIDSALDTSYQRDFAWALRNLFYLAKFEQEGLTTQAVYISALNKTLTNYLALVANPNQPLSQFNVFYQSNYGYYGWGGWMQSFIGIVMNHGIQLGFDAWLPVAEWHFTHLINRCGNKWPIKACDNNHINYFTEYPDDPVGRVAAAQAATWENTHPYYAHYNPAQVAVFDALPDDALPPLSTGITYANRAQYAYAWAALACANSLSGACALRDKIYTAIIDRGDDWDYKNAIVGGVYASPTDPDDDALTPYLPTPDTITKIPGSEIDVLVQDGEFSYCGQIGCYKSYNAFLAWNIGAYDDQRKLWWFPAGGGHGDYGGNEVYLFDFTKLLWSRETDPSPLTGPFLRDTNNDGVNDECPSPVNGPLSSHTYSSVIALPSGDVAISIGSGFCGNKNPIGLAQSWLYHPPTKTWAMISPDRDLTAGAVYHKDRNVIYSLYSQNPMRVQAVDPITWAWTPDFGWTTYGYHIVSVLDSNGETLWVTNDNQGLNRAVWDGVKFVHLGNVNTEFGRTTKTSKFIQDKHGRLIAWDGQDVFQIYTPETGEYEERIVAGYIPSASQARMNNMAYLPEYDAIALINDPRQGVFLVRVK